MDELLDQLRSLTSTDDIGSIADQLGNLYNGFVADRDTSLGERDTRIEGLTADVADRDDQIKTLQAENYKLMTAVANAGEDSSGSERRTGDPERADAADAEIKPIEDFLIDDEEEKEER